MDITSPKHIAERGEEIYRTKYKASYEEEHWGKYVAIDVLTEHAYVDETPEGALEKARTAAPRGLFHLIRVGSPGAFRVSYTNDTSVDWLFQ